MLSQPYARRATRRAVDLPCQIVSRHWDEPIQHCLANLSPFGAWIDTSFPLPIGERVVLSFATPPSGLPRRCKMRHQQEFLVFAEVRRLRRSRDGTRGGMGIEFVDLPKVERHALGRSLRSRS
jgi:hypothetical protein